MSVSCFLQHADEKAVPPAVRQQGDIAAAACDRADGEVERGKCGVFGKKA